MKAAELIRAMNRGGRRKYLNKKPDAIDGIRFDSLREAEHYANLKILQSARQILDLECHPRYPIVINGEKICTVELDFRFKDVRCGTIRVQDVKGFDTALSRLKRRLVKAVHGVEVEVVK